MGVKEGNFPRFDLPMEKRCLYCGQEAKWLCDAYVGVIFDAPNEKGIKTPIQRSQCSIPMCDKCTFKFNGYDFCKEHSKEIRK